MLANDSELPRVPATDSLVNAKMKPKQFNNLCSELKDLIWRATWEPRIVCLGADLISPRHFGFFTHARPPVSLWVDRHSRHETLRHYHSLSFTTDAGSPSHYPSRWTPRYDISPNIVLNPHLDVVSFHDDIESFADIESRINGRASRLPHPEVMLQVVNLFNLAMPGSWKMIKYIEMGGDFFMRHTGGLTLTSQRFCQLVEIIFQSPAMQALSIYRRESSRDDTVDELWFRIARRPLSWDTDPDIAALPSKDHDEEFDNEIEDIDIVDLMTEHQAVPIYSDSYPPEGLAIFEVHRGPSCLCHWSAPTWRLHQSEEHAYPRSVYGDIGENFWDDLHEFYEAFVGHWDDWSVGISHGICAYDYMHVVEY